MDKILMTTAALTLCGYLTLMFVRPESAASGLEFTTEMFFQALPWMIVSMFTAGLLAQFFDPAVIARILGRESGIRGVLVGACLGLAGTGSRWAAYPLAAGLVAAEASPGAVFAFLTSWQLVSLSRLPAEVPFLGMRFTVIRAALSFALAIVGGLVVDHWVKSP
ncbi:permease [Alicyclobacillus cycloheptanicus]|uniref:Uncharacterized membrane protein YraQ (UPF0718 family) n=1 Tax=Alicyclobacillus cycloheptanicus TaxID=1457 RepID=A0ABT9XEA1_9BACL|nr:permease [Alicyclobacillus cycloheptanicus]MDQ0188404.1 uncharacterized membrane protein YraQ (UPF0718 family) [Alicyclobacillus cycloheptanicus]WDM01109.1 permease [Alicyclobacillus cycloheptanicus]